MDFDINTAQVRGKGRKKTRKDIARARTLIRQIREGCDKSDLFKGMTAEQVLERLRQTREEVWLETKHAAAARH